MPIYSIDSSSLVAGWRELYPPQNFPGFWESFHELALQGHVVASREVLRELGRRDDELFRWCKEHKDMFIEVDEACQRAVTEIMRKYPRLVDTRAGKSAGDPFVIALAYCYDPLLATVSEEKGGSAERPKIPSVCRAEGIECITLLELIQRQGWTFGR